MPPTFIQRLFLAILPQSWAESMIADSKAWHAHCPCGHARSIWNLGAFVGKRPVPRGRGFGVLSVVKSHGTRFERSNLPVRFPQLNKSQ